MSDASCINCGVERENAKGIFWMVGVGVYQCNSCKEEYRMAKIALRQETGFSHENTDDVVCPNCGYEYPDSWEMHDGEVFDCPECEKEFSLTVDISVSYTTSKTEENE